MSKGLPKIYFDACCFIDIVTHQLGGKIEAGRENHTWYCYNLLKASQNGEIQVFSSQLTIVECLSAKK